MAKGNCYVASEAHWFLKHRGMGMIIDPSVKQFAKTKLPEYGLARGCGFLTKQPSKRAKQLIKELTYA